jgi:hypothetical protein
MRYRLLATYQGAPYEAGIGPDETGVVLFAACPPPEELRFEPATGHWRKRVRRADVQALYQSRPVGIFRGERCVVLDDLTDRLHIAYLGHDAYRAERLGYWEVDRGVFELITPRQEVTEIVEQRLPLTPQAGSGSWPGLPSLSQVPVSDGLASVPVADEPPLPLEAEAMRAAGLSEPSSAVPSGADTSAVPSWTPHPHVPDPSETALAAGPPPGGRAAPRPALPDPAHRPAAARDTATAHGVPQPAPPGDAAPGPVNGAVQEGQASAAGMLTRSVPSPGLGPGLAERPLAAVTAAGHVVPVGSGASGPAVSEARGSSRTAVPQSLTDGQRPAPAANVTAMAVAEAPAVLAEAGSHTVAPADDARPAPPRRRASRRRLPTQRIFSELAAQAAIPPGAYAINEDVDGAMCLVRTAEGFEVFNSLAGARHEVRVFQDEESAYFYLFGVLVADAVRTGVLAPRT